MTTLYLLRVFTSTNGEHGNPLAVVLSGREVEPRIRQAIALDLGVSEVVFLDDEKDAVVRIFSPLSELPFAGHPLIGASWLIRRELREVSVLRPPVGDVDVWAEGATAWLRARPEWALDWEQVQLSTPAEVESLEATARADDLTQFWAWDDVNAGSVRVRVFAGRLGTREDEACGSASILLAHRLRRPLTIAHGSGSIIFTRPGPDDTVEIGGTAVLDSTRDYDFYAQW